jgi:hypothetical protein
LRSFNRCAGSPSFKRAKEENVEQRIKDRHLRPVNLEERGGAVGGGGGVVQQYYSKHIVLGEKEEKVFLELARYLIYLAFLVQEYTY